MSFEKLIFPPFPEISEKNWRPDGWKGLQLLTESGPLPANEKTAEISLYEKIYEAGADALLKKMKESGIYALHHSCAFDGFGWIVFIPDKGREVVKDDNKSAPIINPSH